MIVTPAEVPGLLGRKATVDLVNKVRRQCARGEVVHAEKIGGEWYIDAAREWPRLFGDGKEEA